MSVRRTLVIALICYPVTNWRRHLYTFVIEWPRQLQPPGCNKTHQYLYLLCKVKAHPLAALSLNQNMASDWASLWYSNGELFLFACTLGNFIVYTIKRRFTSQFVCTCLLCTWIRYSFLKWEYHLVQNMYPFFRTQ